MCTFSSSKCSHQSFINQEIKIFRSASKSERIFANFYWFLYSVLLVISTNSFIYDFIDGKFSLIAFTAQLAMVVNMFVVATDKEKQSRQYDVMMNELIVKSVLES